VLGFPLPPSAATEKEISYLRNSTSDLGESDIVAVSLQLKIANAILDSDFNEKILKRD